MATHQAILSVICRCVIKRILPLAQIYSYTNTNFTIVDSCGQLQLTSKPFKREIAYLAIGATGGAFSQQKSDTAFRPTLSGRRYSLVFPADQKKNQWEHYKLISGLSLVLLIPSPFSCLLNRIFSRRQYLPSYYQPTYFPKRTVTKYYESYVPP